MAAGLLAGSAGGQGRGDPVDPPTYGQAVVSVDGVELGAFAEVVSITSEVEAPVLAPAPGKDTIKKSLGAVKAPVVVLERGLSPNLALWAWHAQAREGGTAGVTAPRTVTLVVFGDDGAPLARFLMTNAWPSKLEVRTASDGGRSRMLIERATFAMDALERLQP